MFNIIYFYAKGGPQNKQKTVTSWAELCHTQDQLSIPMRPQTEFPSLSKD